MRIQSLKAPQDNAALAGTAAANGHDHGGLNGNSGSGPDEPANLAERQALEIALLKARIQHLELVVETARSLMGSNQEKLLRRLHDIPRDIANLSAQLRRVDPQGVW